MVRGPGKRLPEKRTQQDRVPVCDFCLWADCYSLDFFFSALACRFSFMVFWGFFLSSFLVSMDFPIMRLLWVVLVYRTCSRTVANCHCELEAFCVLRVEKSIRIRWGLADEPVCRLKNFGIAKFRVLWQEFML